MVQRVTKQQAMVSMGISSSTLERRIKSGEVQVEVDHAGSRRRVWVVVDDDPADEPPGIQHDIQHPTGDTQVVVMQVKLDNALALAEYRAELLRESETRFHELLQQMNSLTRALPAPAGEAPAELVAMAKEHRSLMHHPLRRQFPRPGAETETEGTAQRRPLKRPKTKWAPGNAVR